MKRLSEAAKIDIGLVAQALNNSNATGRYFAAGDGQRMLFILNGGAMAATKTSKIELLQASDALGTGAKAITSATATITANALVTVATVALAAAANTDTVTINGITFTMAAATDATAREFADAAGLVACVNHATYGVSGVSASASGTDVTLIATEPGATVLTVVGGNVAGTVTVATAQAQAYVDLDVSQLDLVNGFTHVAAKVTTTANSVVAVTTMRYDERWSPTQRVGASAVV